MKIPKITGPQVLRAVQDATKTLAPGAKFAITLSDAEDLFKLTTEELVGEFGVEASRAAQISATLMREDLTELNQHLGIHLFVDKSVRKSLIPNAGLIRSAGAWADNPYVANTPDEIVKQIREMRNPSRVD